MTHLSDELLFRELTGELSDIEKNELKLHLEKCAECRTLHQNYIKTDRLIMNIEPPEVSEEFTSAVMNRIKPVIIRSGISTGRFLTYLSLTFVTLFSVLAGYLISNMNQGSREGGGESVFNSVDFTGYYEKIGAVISSQAFQIVSMVLFFGFAVGLFFTYEKFRKLKSY